MSRRGFDAKLFGSVHTIERLVADPDLATAERACIDIYHAGYRAALEEAEDVLRYFTERHEMTAERRTGFAQALDLLEGMHK